MWLTYSYESIAFSAIRKIAILEPAPINPSKIVKLAIISTTVSAILKFPERFNLMQNNSITTIVIPITIL